MSIMPKCSICRSTGADEWYNCVVCGKMLCDECGVVCSKCGKPYCLGKCGSDYIGPYTDHYCKNCK